MRLASDGEYAEAFRERFETAVRRSICGARRVGSTVSGGLDSSAVVCMAHEIGAAGGAAVPTFSLLFDDTPESDERRYIAALVESGVADPHYVHMDGVSPLASFEDVFRELDEPHPNPNVYLYRALCEAASRSDSEAT